VLFALERDHHHRIIVFILIAANVTAVRYIALKFANFISKHFYLSLARAHVATPAFSAAANNLAISYEKLTLTYRL
jgi:hypothetical protein